jgi:hypothetical protein
MCKVYIQLSGPAEQPDYRQCQESRTIDEVLLAIKGVEVGRIAVRELTPKSKQPRHLLSYYAP